MHTLFVGQTHESTITITPEMVETFARATGDLNPIHLDEEYARGTIFKTRVAHGMLLAGVLSGILGTRFPGIGTIYLSQTLKFVRPVLIGDRITWRITVREINAVNNRALLDTICVNQKGERVITGEALVALPPRATPGK